MEIYNASTAEKIERLHEEAEELADLAKHITDPKKSEALKRRATAKVREAARLREVGQ